MTTILEEAGYLVDGDREKDYGHPVHDFTRIAAFWSIVLDTPVKPEQVALCMVALKISRQINSPKRDNLVDGCGYFRTIEKIEDYNRDAASNQTRPGSLLRVPKGIDPKEILGNSTTGWYYMNKENKPVFLEEEAGESPSSSSTE